MLDLQTIQYCDPSICLTCRSYHLNLQVEESHINREIEQSLHIPRTLKRVPPTALTSHWGRRAPRPPQQSIKFCQLQINTALQLLPVPQHPQMEYSNLALPSLQINILKVHQSTWLSAGPGVRSVLWRTQLQEILVVHLPWRDGRKNESRIKPGTTWIESSWIRIRKRAGLDRLGSL